MTGVQVGVGGWVMDVCGEGRFYVGVGDVGMRGRRCYSVVEY